MRARLAGSRPALMAGVALAAIALAVIAYSFSLFRSLELNSVDARFSLRGTQDAPSDLAVVAVDDVTFDELGRRCGACAQWPFARSLHARLIDRLRKAGAKTIAIDIQFTEPSRGPNGAREDNALILALRHAGGVVLSTTEVDPKTGRTQVLGGGSGLRFARAQAANTGLESDPGGVFRKVDYSIDGLISFAVATAEAATGRKISRSDLGDDGEAWIDFRGPPETIRTYSYSRVLFGEVPARALRDKVIVVGASAPSLQDVHATSTTGDELMSGPELQANAVWTAEEGFPLQSSPGWLNVLFIVALGVAAPAATLRFRPVPSLLIALALGCAYAIAAKIAFDDGTIIPVVYPLGALILAAAGAMAVNYVIAAFERQRVRDTFARFVPENVVGDVLARADGLRLGGIERESTVMFCDLRGFTSFAETLPPAQVIELLNHYLSGMSDAILDHGGTLVAYMGDGIMAVFGAPIEQDDHADRALAAAREMLTVRLPEFNQWIRSQGFEQEFRMGIGLNSGRVMSGNVGSERRVEYTAIGDTTNTAARIEGMTKGTPHQLFVADSTRSLLGEQPSDLIFVDELEVRGRQAKVKLYSIADGGEAPAPSGAAEPAVS
jgi:adenylate cyclase